MSYRSLILTSLVPALLTALAAADTIHTTEGRTITDCTVVEESLLEVTYRRGGSSRTTMPASEVLRIEFTTMPPLVDRAETAVADDQVFDAVNDLTVYLEGALNKLDNGSRVRPAWAPAYAAWRLAELNASMGKVAETLGATDKLLSKFPDSRYVPAALLLKAEVQFAGGEDYISCGIRSVSRVIVDCYNSASSASHWLFSPSSSATFFKLSKCQACSETPSARVFSSCSCSISPGK